MFFLDRLLKIGVQKQNLSKIKPEENPIGILRFKNVDDTLYRGGKPDYEQLEKLKELGIDTVVDFTVSYDFENDKPTEKELVEKLGMKYISMPFMSFNNPPERYVDNFFKIMQDARDNNKKVFIHCIEGKDRTGLFSAMYKVKYNLSDLPSSIKEMLAMGHDYIANPNLIPFLKKFYYEIQPNLNLQPSCEINKSTVVSLK